MSWLRFRTIAKRVTRISSGSMVVTLDFDSFGQCDMICPMAFYWHYVAPHRIRIGALDFPRCRTWAHIEELNLQRFARILEFQGCVAFVGSGASVPLGYPKWNDLLPHVDNVEYQQLRKLLLDENSGLDCPQAIEIAEELLGRGDSNRGRQKIVEHLSSQFYDEIAKKTRRENIFRNMPEFDEPPLPRLLEFPIRRFITTNYDSEIEQAIGKALGLTQDAVNKLSFSQ